MPGPPPTCSPNSPPTPAQYEKLDFAVAHSLIANAVDFVVFIEKNPLLGGRRCVTEVREVVGAPRRPGRQRG